MLGSEPDAGLRRLRYARGRRHISFVGRTSDIPTTVGDLPLFSVREAQALHRKVMDLREHWIGRGSTGDTEFFSLGTACYLDFCCSDDPKTDYLQRAPVANRPLAEAFGDMYERIRAALQDHLGEPVRYTVPFALPRGGGGLDTWNVTPEDVTRAVALGLEPDLDRIKERKFRTYHPYRLGTVALHSGLMLHRIGGVAKIRDSDQRITLQGHGVRVDGTWILHW